MSRQAGMTATAPAGRQALMEVFAGVATQFAEAGNDVEQREAEIFGALAALGAAAQADPWRDSSLPATHPLREAAGAPLAAIRDQFEDWKNAIEQHERGTRFQRNFGDSLLIFIYGKVKAGKSSLGNLLAYGRSQPDGGDIAQASPRPDFFFEADSGAGPHMDAATMAAARCFGVGITETTSAIQGFKLPGLTWIDSPGVHSMRGANEALAKQYASAADLVVFLSHSSSPGRRSDLEEISGLLKGNKPLVVLLSASDLVEMDETPDGELVKVLRMKSEQDRHDQVRYVEGELNTLAPELRQRLLSSDVLPISVRYAEHADDAGAWRDSGLSSFATCIGNIASSSGLRLKQQKPLANLARFCAERHRDTQELVRYFDVLTTVVADGRADLERAVAQALLQLRRALETPLEKLAAQYTMDDRAFRDAAHALFDAELQKQAAGLEAQLQHSLSAFQAKADAMPAPRMALPTFSKRVHAQTYRSATNSKRGAALGGLAAGIAGIFLVASGPIGVAIAAAATLAGGKLGQMAGGRLDGEQSVNVDLGDNRDEVARAMLEHLGASAKLRLQGLSGEIDADCFAPQAAWLRQCTERLDTLRATLAKHATELDYLLTAHGAGLTMEGTPHVAA